MLEGEHLSQNALHLKILSARLVLPWLYPLKCGASSLIQHLRVQVCEILQYENIVHPFKWNVKLHKYNDYYK